MNKNKPCPAYKSLAIVFNIAELSGVLGEIPKIVRNSKNCYNKITSRCNLASNANTRCIQIQICSLSSNHWELSEYKEYLFCCSTQTDLQLKEKVKIVYIAQSRSSDTDVHREARQCCWIFLVSGNTNKSKHFIANIRIDPRNKYCVGK